MGNEAGLKDAKTNGKRRHNMLLFQADTIPENESRKSPAIGLLSD